VERVARHAPGTHPPGGQSAQRRALGAMPRIRFPRVAPSLRLHLGHAAPR